MPDATTDSNKPTTTTGARMASDQANSLMRLATYASVTVAVVLLVTDGLERDGTAEQFERGLRRLPTGPADPALGRFRMVQQQARHVAAGEPVAREP